MTFDEKCGAWMDAHFNTGMFFLCCVIVLMMTVAVISLTLSVLGIA